MDKQSKSTVSGLSILEPTIGSLGLKSVAQLGPAVSGVTCSSLSALFAEYDIISSWLSSDGAATSMNASMLIAITQFNASACKAMLLRDSMAADGSRCAANGVNFAASGTGSGPLGLLGSSPGVIVRKPAGGVPQSPVAKAIEQFTKKFWNRAATDAEFNDIAEATLAAINHSSNFPGGTSLTDQTIGALLVPCTMALSSPVFLAN